MSQPEHQPIAARPRLLDLFCGAGGAAMGYHRAGFDVVGVDIKPQPHYPFEFWQSDAIQMLRHMTIALPFGVLRVEDFQAIHASPPCQASTTMSNRWRGKGGRADSHSNLIAATRSLLLETGLPFVIENVPGARRDLLSPVVLTGEMFGLRVHRPRLFETSFPLLVPEKPPASRDSIGVYGKAPDGRLLWRRRDGTEQRCAASLEEAQEAMGMPWADWRGCCEAIPPAYTELIGAQLLAHVRREVAA